MNKDFKVGDTVKIVGHPYIKDGTLGTVRRLEADNYKLEVRFGDGDIDCLIEIKYLEKEEDWLHFKTTRSNDPLISKIFKLDKEVELYNYMYQWKREFDPEEPDWEDGEYKWCISRYSDGEWHLMRTIDFKENLQVYLTTEDKAEECFEWLKKQGVLY